MSGGRRSLAPSWRGLLIGLAVVASAGWLCWYHLGSDSFLHAIVGTRGDVQQVGLAAYCSYLDQQLTQLSQGHSVVLRFSGFRPDEEPLDTDYILTITRRGNYTLCPKRAYAVVETPPEVPMTSEWFAAHDVQAMLWVVRSPDGRTWSRSWRLPPGTAIPTTQPRDPRDPQGPA